MMNQADIHERNLKNGDIVNIYNNTGGVERVVRNFIIVPYPIPKTCAATYFPETNVLVPISNVAAKSNTPVSKLVIIRLEKVNT